MKASRRGVGRGPRFVWSIIGLMVICTVSHVTNASAHLIRITSETVNQNNYISDGMLTTNRVVNNNQRFFIPRICLSLIFSQCFLPRTTDEQPAFLQQPFSSLLF